MAPVPHAAAPSNHSSHTTIKRGEECMRDMKPPPKSRLLCVSKQRSKKIRLKNTVVVRGPSNSAGAGKLSIIFLSAECRGVVSLALGSAALGSAQFFRAALARTRIWPREKSRKGENKNVLGVVSQLKPIQSISIVGSELNPVLMQRLVNPREPVNQNIRRDHWQQPFRCRALCS